MSDTLAYIHEAQECSVGNFNMSHVEGIIQVHRVFLTSELLHQSRRLNKSASHSMVPEVAVYTAPNISYDLCNIVTDSQSPVIADALSYGKFV